MVGNHEFGGSSLEVKSPVGLVFGFLRRETVDALEQSSVWKDRVAAIELAESQLGLELSTSERKARFMPHATAFLGFIISYIKDPELKISLTAINMTNKLLVLEIA